VYKSAAADIEAQGAKVKKVSEVAQSLEEFLGLRFIGPLELFALSDEGKFSQCNEYGVPLHACHGYRHDGHYWAWVNEKIRLSALGEKEGN